MYGLFTLFTLNQRLSDPTTRSVKDPAGYFGPEFIYYQDQHCRHYWEHRSGSKVVVITYSTIQPDLKLAPTVGDILANNGSGYHVLLFTGDIYSHANGNANYPTPEWDQTNSASKRWIYFDLAIVKILAELLVEGSMDPSDIDNRILYGIKNDRSLIELD